MESNSEPASRKRPHPPEEGDSRSKASKGKASPSQPRPCSPEPPAHRSRSPSSSVVSLGADSDPGGVQPTSLDTNPLRTDEDAEMAPAFPENELEDSISPALHELAPAHSEHAAPQSNDALPWSNGFLAVCMAIATGLNSVTASIRRHRADINAVLPEDLEAGWSVANAAIDRLVETIYQYNGNSFEHVASVACRMQDNAAQLEAELGRPLPPRPSAPRGASPAFRTPSPPASSSPPVPPPLALRLSTPPPPEGASARPLLDRIDLHDEPSFSPRTSPSPGGTGTYAQRAAALPRLASRMSPGRTDDPYDSASLTRSLSRGRSPSRRKLRRPPPNANRIVHVQFDEGYEQSPEMWTDNGSLQQRLNTGFERYGDPEVQLFRVESLGWNAGGSITLILNRPPNPEVLGVICENVAQLQRVPRPAVRAGPHRNHISLAFNRVPCEDASGNPIEPRIAAAPLFADPVWREVVTRPDASFRWVRSSSDASSAKLAVQFDDDRDHETSHRLLAQPVLFPEGITRAQILPDRNVLPQCANCWTWGHTAKRCHHPYVVCARCGGPHPARFHHGKAACCKTDPNFGKPGFQCPHPPWCCNCGGPHFANDRQRCPFAQNRADASWLASHPRALARDRADSRSSSPAPPRSSASSSSNQRMHNPASADAPGPNGGRAKGGDPSPTGPAERTDDNMLYGTQLHPAWHLVENRKDSRVVCHVNRRLVNAVISLNSSVSHRDCMLLQIRLDPSHDPTNILNVYNDAQNSAVLYLADIAHNLPPIDVAGGDYNTHSRLWDPTFPQDSRSRVGEVLDLHAQLGLRLLSPPGVQTHFPHREGLRATVIDLVWVPNDRDPALYDIRVAPEERGLSDHALIHVRIPTGEWSYQGSPTISPGSAAEQHFIAAILASTRVRIAEHPPLTSEPELQRTVDTLFDCIADAWNRNATPVVICNKSRLWWDASCTRARDALWQARAMLQAARARRPALIPIARTRVTAAQRRLKTAIRARRRQHMDERIKYVAEQQRRVWDLMSWVGPRPLPMYQSLRHNGQPLRTLPDLWQALDQTFHAAAERPVDLSILDEIPAKPTRTCHPISIAEIEDAIRSVSTSSTPGWDHLHWRHLKLLLADPHFLATLHWIYNAILELGIWPSQFKRAVSVVIPKPYKDDYSRIKSYRPIVLLSTLGKLFEKVISERLHYECQRYGILHPNQFGGTKAHSTIDAATMLVTHVRMGWRRKLVTSCLAFDVAQFFPSMNHDLMCRILERYGFSERIVRFFRHYLSGRVSCFRWGRASSPWFDLPAVGAGQGSALSPILTNIYISPALHILSPLRSNPSVSTLQFYVDDGLWFVTTPSVEENCRRLAVLYHRTTVTLERLGLFVEIDKNELMHFISAALARSQDPLPLHLDNGVVIQPSQIWRYLGFRLDPRLSFRAHVDFFAERALTTVHAMLMLGNSVRGLTPMQKRTLYISCVLPLLTYGAQVWFKSKGVKTLMKPLLAAQNRALRWITGAFRTTPIGAMQTMAGIMPLQLHCRKLQERYGLRVHTLPRPHPLRALFPHIFKPSRYAPPVRFTLENVPPTAAIPMTEAFPNGDPLVTEKFNPLDPECEPGQRIRDLFADRVTTHLEHPKKKHEAELAKWITDELKPRIARAHSDPDALVLFTDGSAIYSERDGNLGGAAGYRAYHGGRLLVARAVYTGYTFAYDCELMALAMAIGFAYLKRYHHVHIFADSESALKSLLDTSDGRMTNLNACRILRDWFERDERNHLHLHYCPSHRGVDENEAVDADVRYRVHHPGRSRGGNPKSFSYIRSIITQNVTYDWRESARANPRAYWGRFYLRHAAFRTLRHTGAYPLKRLGGRPQFAARFVRCVTAHAPTGHYRDRFRFRHNEPTMCFCGRPSYHTREHVLFECDKYTRKYRYSSIEDLLESLDPFYDIEQFLRDNPAAFTFDDAPAY
ncbi:hypothetical protein ACG7TL_002941 [Trametes sanguinea]